MVHAVAESGKQIGSWTLSACRRADIRLMVQILQFPPVVLDLSLLSMSPTLLADCRHCRHLPQILPTKFTSLKTKGGEWRWREEWRDEERKSLLSNLKPQNHKSYQWRYLTTSRASTSKPILATASAAYGLLLLEPCKNPFKWPETRIYQMSATNHLLK